MKQMKSSAALKSKQGPRTPSPLFLKDPWGASSRLHSSWEYSLKTTGLDNQILLAPWLYNYYSQILKMFKIDTVPSYHFSTFM